MHYVQVLATGDLPNLSTLGPFKAIVIADVPVTPERRETISDWLVASGCLYLMTWGYDCGDWAATVARLNRAAHDTEQIPDDHVVITTTHAGEPLENICWYAKYTAMHPCAELRNCVVVHAGSEERGQVITETFAAT